MEKPAGGAATRPVEIANPTQMLYQKFVNKTISYGVIGQEGNPPNTTFIMQVTIDDQSFTGSGKDSFIINQEKYSSCLILWPFFGSLLWQLICVCAAFDKTFENIWAMVRYKIIKDKRKIEQSRVKDKIKLEEVFKCYYTHLKVKNSSSFRRIIEKMYRFAF